MTYVISSFKMTVQRRRGETREAGQEESSENSKERAENRDEVMEEKRLVQVNVK